MVRSLWPQYHSHSLLGFVHSHNEVCVKCLKCLQKIHMPLGYLHFAMTSLHCFHQTRSTFRNMPHLPAHPRTSDNICHTKIFMFVYLFLQISDTGINNHLRLSLRKLVKAVRTQSHPFKSCPSTVKQLISIETYTVSAQNNRTAQPNKQTSSESKNL